MVEKDLLKQMVQTMKESISQTERLIKDMEDTIEKLSPREEPKPEPVKAGRRKEDKAGRRAEDPILSAPSLPPLVAPAEEPKKNGVLLVGDVTIEMLREMATKYSAAFGMEKLLALNVKYGGAKKLSGIDPKMYGVLYGSMQNELAQGAEKPAALKIEDVRPKAADFMKANGLPALTALLKQFGAEKLSGLDAAKYPAFLEAISNV